MGPKLLTAAELLAQNVSSQSDAPPIPVSCPTLGTEEEQAVARVFKSGWLGLGEEVSRFETALKDYLGAKHVVAVNTGTSALHLALVAAGVQPGDEVILPSLTFVGCPQAVRMCGAVPVFCDIDPETFLMSAASAEECLSDRTAAIMPVHFAGRVCETDELRLLSRGKSIPVIEDAAHAFGSSLNGSLVGSSSRFTCFSFDPIKVITCGEGGAIATSDAEVAEKIRRARNLGIDREAWRRRGEVRSDLDGPDQVVPGFRYHLSNLNAAIGLTQLARLPQFIRSRREIAERYSSFLSAIPGVIVPRTDWSQVSPFIFVARILDDRRDTFRRYLQVKGIETGVHYTPNHLLELFPQADSQCALPHTEKVYQELVTLPLYSHLSDCDLARVLETIGEFFADA